MGSSPIVGLSRWWYGIIQGQCPEWQRGRTVNPLAVAFEGSSPSWPTGSISQDAVLSVLEYAHVAQAAEHILGKNEVMGSIPIVGFLPRSPGMQFAG